MKLPENHVEKQEGDIQGIAAGTKDAFQLLTEMPDAIKNVFQTLSDIINWFKNFPEHVTEFTTTVTASMYDLITMLILRTPLWLFDNTWFENTTYLMSIISIGVVTTFTIIEGIKRKFQRRFTNLRTIGKRWFVVAGLSALAPQLLYKWFQLINFATDKITGMSGEIINSPIEKSLPLIDIFILTAFNIAILVMTVPILLKNAKRFFDILTLGLISPLAGASFVFDSHQHLFKQWWSNLKRLSLVQIVYAFYLMIIGLFIYGAPTPDTLTGAALKMFIVVGGFMRLINPPNFVQRYLDSGDIRDTINDGKRAYGKFKDYASLTVKTIKNPSNAIKFLSRSAEPKLVTKQTRMNRIHGK